MISVTEKIRQHFRRHPTADVKKAAAKFNQPVSRIYKLRKEVHEDIANAARREEMDTPEVGEWKTAIREAGASLTALAMPELAGEELNIIATLSERAKDYGKFKDGAALMQGMKRLLADHAAKHDKTFTDDQWEALEMIVHKIGRIVNGNPDKVDHWVDIAGYATLVADRLQGNAR